MPLEWVEAQRTHRRQLGVFVCANPESRSWDRRRGPLPHPRECDLKVQSDIRDSVKPPRQKPEYLYVGIQDSKVVAVLNFFVNVEEDAVFVLTIARAVSVSGEHVGQSAMDKLRELLSTLAPGMRITARIAPSNDRSAKLFSANGFRLTSNGTTYDLWERASFETASVPAQTAVGEADAPIAQA